MKRLILIFTAVVLLTCCQLAYSQETGRELSKEEITAIATEEAKAKGIDITEAAVFYDENGKRWCETAGIIGMEDSSPNHGILKKGFLKNYKIVIFDFVAPVKDVWVFVDKDTGEVLEVYREK